MPQTEVVPVPQSSASGRYTIDHVLVWKKFCAIKIDVGDFADH